MLFTSELQTPITFLFVNENIKCWYSFSKLEHANILVTKLFGFAKKNVFAFSAPPSSVRGALRNVIKIYDDNCLTL